MSNTVKMIIGFAVAVLVLGGLIFVLQGSDDEGTTANEANEIVEVSENNFINAYSGSYTVKMSATGGSNEDIKGEIQVKSPTQTYMTFTSDGEKVEYMVYDGTYYLKAGGSQWLSYGDQAVDGATATYLDNAVIDESRVEEYQAKSTKVGEEACGSDTCDVYEISTEEGKSTILVSQSTKLVHRVTTSSPEDGKLELVFDYESQVNFTPPQNAQEFTVPSFEGIPQ